MLAVFVVSVRVAPGTSLRRTTMRLLKTNLVIALATIFVLTLPMVASAQLIITGTFDGPLAGGLPKGVELYVVSDIADLSAYGLGSANNGGGTDGEEFTFPADAAVAGSYIWACATDDIGFTAFFGFPPTYVDSGYALSINGDDAVELFHNGVVVDIFGDIDTDGTGEPWDHLDGWAYRVNNTGPDGDVFDLASWSFSGTNVFDATLTNAEAIPSMPIGTYTMETVGSTSETMDSIKALYNN